MPTERAPTPSSHTAISLGNSSSDDRNSERSDSIATIEIFRPDGDRELTAGTPSENTENTACENVSRLRAPDGDGQKFASYDIPDVPLERRKSNGISKGVILNAMNFGSYDLKCTADELKEKAVMAKEQEICENGSASPKALDASSEKEDGKEEEKKKMSLPRKIAFGFSFLPSVMFVLTFAVILPCDDYKYNQNCAINRWSLFLNHTEITSDLGLPETLLLGYHFVNSTTSSFGGLVNLNDSTGKEIWKLPLDSVPKHLECLYLDANEDGVQDCFAVLENGNVCAFNLSDGEPFWTFSSVEPKTETILLSECPDYNGSKAIAFASYGENTLGIHVLRTDGSLLKSEEVKLENKCMTFSMKSWAHDSETDLVFLCENVLQGLGYISRVRQSFWCPLSKEESVNEPQVMMRFGESTTQAIYIPTNEGLLVWRDTNITFLKSDGTTKWNDSASYVPQSRIAKFGGFYKDGEQVALIGQNASSGIVVSVLSSENGTELSTFSIPDRTLNQAVVLQENGTAATLLISVLKITETEQVPDKEVVLLSNVSSSPDFRTDVPYKMNEKKSIVEELVLLQFEGKNTTDVILKSETSASCENGEVCKFEYRPSHIASAFSEEKDNSVKLKIVMLKSSANSYKQNGSQLFSQLTALEITHQDSPDDGETSCTL